MMQASLFPSMPLVPRACGPRKKNRPGVRPEPVYTLARSGANLETVFEAGSPPWEPGPVQIEPPRKIEAQGIIAVLTIGGKHFAGLFGNDPPRPVFGNSKDKRYAVAASFAPDGFVVAVFERPADGFPRRFFPDPASLAELIPAAIRYRVPASLQQRLPKPPRPQPA